MVSTARFQSGVPQQWRYLGLQAGPSPSVLTLSRGVRLNAWRMRQPSLGEFRRGQRYFSNCRARVGCGPAPEPTLKKPCAFGWWAGRQIHLEIRWHWWSSEIEFGTSFLVRFSFVVKWHINISVSFDRKPNLAECTNWYYLIKRSEDKKVQTFPLSINLKVNVPEQPEFELAYNYSSVQLLNYYVTGTGPSLKNKFSKFHNFCLFLCLKQRGSLNKFPDFFVRALLLIVHIWNSLALRSNLLRLRCTYRSKKFWKAL